ncbi:MAG: hypothetical protein KTR25_15570 [Myxococcales bacterium]|nr:hypothetical protein [Myxococcales bacterium]
MVTGLVGCASSVKSWHRLPSSTLEVLVKRSSVGLSPDVDVLAISPEAKAWLAEHFDDALGQREATMTRLANAFTPKGLLTMHYDDLGVFTASEVFTLARGNCLSFTHLFVAMGRHLGVPVRYREILQVPIWHRQDKFIIRSRHVVAYVDLGGGRGTYQVDFGGQTSVGMSLVTGISDESARAQHFNNLGALSITKDQIDEAIRYFNRALVIDSKLPYVWANLGVAYVLKDDARRAEWAYLESIRLDPYDIGTLHSLVELYRRNELLELAEHYSEQAERARYQNPFAEYERGVEARLHKRWEDAVRHLSRAARALPHYMRVHMYLGEAYLGIGDGVAAQKAFLKAEERADSEEERNHIYELLNKWIEAHPSPDTTPNVQTEGGTQ